LVSIVESRLYEEDSYVDTNENFAIEDNSEISFDDKNAEFRKANGEFDDEKYRKSVIDMLVKDVHETIKKPKRYQQTLHTILHYKTLQFN